MGSYIKPNCIYPAKRLQKNAFKKFKLINQQWVEQDENVLNADLVNHTLASVNSYFGILKNTDSFCLRNKLWNTLSLTVIKHFNMTRNRNKIYLLPDTKKRLMEQIYQSTPTLKNKTYDIGVIKKRKYKYKKEYLKKKKQEKDKLIKKYDLIRNKMVEQGIIHKF